MLSERKISPWKQKRFYFKGVQKETKLSYLKETAAKNLSLLICNSNEHVTMPKY